VTKEDQEKLLAVGKKPFMERCAKCHDERGDKPLKTGPPLTQNERLELKKMEITGTKKQRVTAEEQALRREPSEEEIRHRAYEIYLARGGAPGDEVEDWLQAERELHSEREPI